MKESLSLNYVKKLVTLNELVAFENRGRLRKYKPRPHDTDKIKQLLKHDTNVSEYGTPKLKKSSNLTYKSTMNLAHNEEIVNNIGPRAEYRLKYSRYLKD